METIFQSVKVTNNQIHLTLPDNFNFEEVDVFIMPKNNDFLLTEEMKQILDKRSADPLSTFITAEESIRRLKMKVRV